jgi:hypothetical protein
MSFKPIISLCESETGEGFSEKKPTQNLGIDISQKILTIPKSGEGQCHTI